MAVEPRSDTEALPTFFKVSLAAEVVDVSPNPALAIKAGRHTGTVRVELNNVK